MSLNHRRIFLLQAAACGSVLAGANLAHAQAVKLDEKDPQAVGLGYLHDTTKVDAKKYPKHTAEQKCSNCALFQAKAGDPWGGCPLFGAKQVNANGWCTAWAKKA